MSHRTTSSQTSSEPESTNASTYPATATATHSAIRYHIPTHSYFKRKKLSTQQTCEKKEKRKNPEPLIIRQLPQTGKHRS